MKFKLDIAKLKISAELEPVNLVPVNPAIKFNNSESLIFELDGETHGLKFNDLKRKDANKILGDGASSVVIEMVHNHTKKSFAVKKVQEQFYHSELATASGTENEYKDEDTIETSVLEKLKCFENIIQYYGYYYVERCVWIVSELMDMSLKELYTRADKSKKTVPEALIAKIALSMLKAIDYLEENNFLHRDIKPDNVLINLDGTVKLCDFGSVGKLDDKNECKDRRKGTVRYKAPEKLNSNDHNGYSTKSDLWSFGLTLLEIANLKRPYDKATNLLGLQSAIFSDEVPKLSDESYSENFKEFLSLCLEKDVEKRADCKALMNHDFLKNINFGAAELQFLREIMNGESTD